MTFLTAKYHTPEVSSSAQKNCMRKNVFSRLVNFHHSSSIQTIFFAFNSSLLYIFHFISASFTIIHDYLLEIHIIISSWSVFFASESPWRTLYKNTLRSEVSSLINLIKWYLFPISRKNQNLQIQSSKLAISSAFSTVVPSFLTSETGILNDAPSMYHSSPAMPMRTIVPASESSIVVPEPKKVYYCQRCLNHGRAEPRKNHKVRMLELL